MTACFYLAIVCLVLPLLLPFPSVRSHIELKKQELENFNSKFNKVLSSAEKQLNALHDQNSHILHGHHFTDEHYSIETPAHLHYREVKFGSLNLFEGAWPSTRRLHMYNWIRTSDVDILALMELNHWNSDLLSGTIFHLSNRLLIVIEIAEREWGHSFTAFLDPVQATDKYPIGITSRFPIESVSFHTKGKAKLRRKTFDVRNRKQSVTRA